MAKLKLFEGRYFVMMLFLLFAACLIGSDTTLISAESNDRRAHQHQAKNQTIIIKKEGAVHFQNQNQKKIAIGQRKSAYKPYSHRELRGRGGGRSSSRSSYSSSSSAKRVSSSYRYTYSTYKTPLTRTNAYWDGKRTYSQLYSYYRPVGYYNVRGYYSTTFLLIYYNGYGYNFYYGGYGYYEYSVHPEDTSTRDLVISICIGVCCYCLVCFMCWRCAKDVDDEEDSEEIYLSDVSDSDRKKKRRNSKSDDSEENRPYDPNQAAYPPGYDPTMPAPFMPPPPDMSGYTMNGPVLGVPVFPPQPIDPFGGMQSTMGDQYNDQFQYPNLMKSNAQAYEQNGMMNQGEQVQQVQQHQGNMDHEQHQSMIQLKPK